jgi:hypothetical protein
LRGCFVARGNPETDKAFVFAVAAISLLVEKGGLASQVLGYLKTVFPLSLP